ncbi:5-formyltetrahydrofolate cyclo-ligase [Deinococcus radiopugnans]|uniref:5-formyltetrahydrofolate cyclo-ligase n=1 Tax=Deinococcus radiopugnans TaxID=57497 RepID=A0A0A7KJT2_9DEIO|nr:5-formyltetrahydrofolate cyclo-ligase [Deinococcus radiopugnans]
MPPQDPTSWDKGQWRAWARQHRQQRPDHSAAITAHLSQFLQDAGVQRVLAYRALPGEPDVAALAHDFELLAPRARFRPTPRLTLHPWATATEPSRFGTLQPPADAPEISLDTIDAVLLPGLAFDVWGVRLGYGGGFYDRLLPAFSGLTVGVIADSLIVPELPAEDHDCPVAWLATEDGVLRVPIAPLKETD